MSVFDVLRFVLTVAAWQEMQPLLSCGGCGEPSVLILGRAPTVADGCAWVVDDGEYLFDCCRDGGRD